MRAGPRVVEEGANLVGCLRRQNVLELAGLLLDFGLAIHREGVGEKPLGQPVTTDDIGGSLEPARRQLHD